MFVEINGARLRVETRGDPAAPLLIGHHGAPGLGSHAEPLRSFGPLSDALHVVVFDARGSGASDIAPPFTHAQWVTDVDALRDHLGAERLVMAGGSYGGFISLEYALAHPDRVRALVLRDTAAHGGFDEQARKNAFASQRVEVDVAKFDRIFAGTIHDDADLEACWREIVPLYDHDPDPARARARLEGTVYHHQSHNAAFRDNMPRYNLLDRLSEIRCPTLVTVGRHDWITPVAASEEIASRIPNAELVVFENSGHSPPSEEPERFQQVVRDFLRSAGVL
ncbi:MAG: alpha/beta hydrolase [Candidatus Dormibacteria bacterium]